MEEGLAIGGEEESWMISRFERYVSERLYKGGTFYLPLRPQMATFSPGWMNRDRSFMARFSVLRLLLVDSLSPSSSAL
jgi:hypothetical protein